MGPCKGSAPDSSWSLYAFLALFIAKSRALSSVPVGDPVVEYIIRKTLRRSGLGRLPRKNSTAVIVW